MKKIILPLVLGTILFASCEKKTETSEAFNVDSTKKEIDAWQEKFEASVKNKDSVAFANLFTEDAVRMGPNAVQVEGRANILKSVVEPLKVIGSTNLTTTDAMGDEQTVTTFGTYEHFLIDGTSIDKGKYMGIFKRIDGKLVAVRDIWNSDAAAQIVK